ncbi:MAG: N,N-dimethylformamidase large subunit [Proteobacteria bacterium]|nr:N,N-dimethylformamidase large subunit [Pseudomonadota bacterium]
MACAIPLIGYTDAFSARAGGRIAVKVSSTFSAPYRADLVRIFSGDPNPAGPGMRMEPVPSAFESTYPSRLQPVHAGSCGLVQADRLSLDGDWTLSVNVQPWRLADREPQAVLALSGGAGLALSVSKDGASLRVGDAVCHVGAPMLERRWYALRIVASGGALRLTQTPLQTDWGTDGAGEATLRAPPPVRAGTVLFAADFTVAPVPGAHPYRDHFDGRIEHPTFTCDGAVLAWWDFSQDIPTARITDRGPLGLHGAMVNQPTRAMRGSAWDGSSMRWSDKPEHYAAVHFHADDLNDCGWDTDFVFDVPPDLPSGVYGIRLRCEDAEDVVPVFVLPPPGAATAKVAVLFPTYTYQVYANYDRANFDAAFAARRAEWRSYPHHPAENKQFGLSTYDWHGDGSGVAYSSLMRPIMTMRAGYIAYVDLRGSGLRHFPSDLHLVAWLDAMGISFDAITDHDLEREGEALLGRYACVLTGTHPEYQTPRTWDALHGYISEGGRLVYLGGNGFYWRVAVSDAAPGVIEVRRAEGGTRAWASEPGEYYNALDRGYGGLWRRNGRPPQMLVGVGFSAQGRFEGSYYRRQPASHDADLAWMFAGIEGEVIGDFGYSGGGAAGFEVDRADPLLGTPPNARIVCSSETHQAHFGVTPEELLTPPANFGEPAGPRHLIRSDMVYFETAKGGAVFSVGSITFCGSLPWNGFDNQISRLIRNVVERFSASHP